MTTKLTLRKILWCLLLMPFMALGALWAVIEMGFCAGRMACYKESCRDFTGKEYPTAEEVSVKIDELVERLNGKGKS